MGSFLRPFLALLLGSSLAFPSLGFGTGSHFDLSETVLAEKGFDGTSIKVVQVSNWLTDYYSYSPTNVMKHRRVLEKLHFDNLYDEEQVRAYWSVLLRNLRSSTERAAFNDNPSSMLVILGIGLHSVQDFYSHSNWAELHPSGSNGRFSTETYWRTVRSRGMPHRAGLHTGKFPDDRRSGPWTSPVPPNAAVHGDYHNGLNKDSPTRPRWDEAYVYAYAASHELVDALETWAEKVRPGFWRSVQEFAVDAAANEKLNKDVSAARNISMWLEGKGQDGTWKGEGSGSSRFFTKFAGNWVTDDASIFVKAVRDGKVQDELAKDLYSRSDVPELPDLKPFSLDRTALLVRITYIAESKESNFFERKITAPLGGPDFYSRISVGGQEFWGRSIQRSRKSADPWYEIYIFDGRRERVPIVISIWDEDHTDPSKDRHIDINPAPGRFDLEMLFRTSDGSLLGDLVGTFDSPRKAFSTEGQKPDDKRALVRGFITQRRLN